MIPESAPAHFAGRTTGRLVCLPQTLASCAEVPPIIEARRRMTMPLTPSEPFLFPDDLLAGPPAPEPDRRWWALHTRPRAEKALARKFLAQGLSFFLPLHKRQ